MSGLCARTGLSLLSGVLYGRIVYSHKTHEKEREIWSDRTAWMNWGTVVLTAITTFLAVVSAVLTTKCALITTAIAATATVGFAIWQASFDPAGKETQQRIAGKELLWIREQLMLLIMECPMPSVPLAQLQKGGMMQTLLHITSGQNH